ncbi:MAG: hypothetical protein JW751_02475 [Polyangiaceae bacterium]|nr:hypothetical protein [Polyangiaceae bacterium]
MPRCCQAGGRSPAAPELFKQGLQGTIARLVELPRDRSRRPRPSTPAPSRLRAELLAIATDPDLAEEDAPGDGDAPVHAARLLGRIGDPAAIEPLLTVLQRLDWSDVLYSAICLALPRFGGALVEPALAVLAADPPPAPKRDRQPSSAASASPRSRRRSPRPAARPSSRARSSLAAGRD